MATILLTWELGGGLGHLVNLLPLAKGLFERGHRVVAALRDLSRAEDVFGGVEVTYLQAPVINRPVFQIIEPVRNFAQLLFNNGFSDPAELKIMSRAWLNLYEYVRPDLIVFDHSPTALLAARSCGAKKALVGTGFFCPRNEFPLSDMRPWLGEAWRQMRKDEDYVLHSANQALSALGASPLEYLAQLYHDVDEDFLLTFPELDHFGQRDTGEDYELSEILDIYWLARNDLLGLG